MSYRTTDPVWTDGYEHGFRNGAKTVAERIELAWDEDADGVMPLAIAELIEDFILDKE